MKIASTRHMARFVPLVLLVAVSPTSVAAQDEALVRQVEIVRTTHGVPHIRAENLRAAGFGMGYVQAEDYSERVVRGLIQARGELGRTFGREEMDSDFQNRLDHARAAETYHFVDPDVRDMLEGFAAGVNHYIRVHHDELPEWMRPVFTGIDVAARDIGGYGSAQRFLRHLEEQRAGEQTKVSGDSDVGSNAWALAPGRTRSGKAILLRNPHLSWDAGYYEAHVIVPGVLNFYGDFRVGGPFGIIGGFNERLGWATTNNAPDTDEVYALDVDPERPDHYLFDGASVAITRIPVTIEFRNGDGFALETREILRTPLGSVVERADGKIYVQRAAGAGDYRNGDQFLAMMRARNLEEWKDAMRMRARTSSNFTYADADGNIFYIWNGSVPALPHPSGGDTLAVPAHGASEVWTRLVPFDSLPMLLNPRGGYIHQENDPFHYTNMHEPMDPARFPPNFSQPDLRLRSQHGIQLLHDDRKLSLEDVVALKHSMRMLLADRVKQDLIEAVRRTQPTGEVAAAIDLLEGWDNTVAAESRGGVLFQAWWQRYTGRMGNAEPYLEPWTPERPLETPNGLADPGIAAEAFAGAVDETRRRYGSFDVRWGEVHRVRRGDVDVPVGGCGGALGCFRVLNFQETEDGKRAVAGGDGWVLAVEFTNPPRAFSVLAYGQTDDEESPYHADQAAMFANNEMKPVAFTDEQIREATVVRYRPGDERADLAR